jgi:hypothetical protein
MWALWIQKADSGHKVVTVGTLRLARGPSSVATGAGHLLKHRSVALLIKEAEAVCFLSNIGSKQADRVTILQIPCNSRVLQSFSLCLLRTVFDLHHSYNPDVCVGRAPPSKRLIIEL